MTAALFVATMCGIADAQSVDVGGGYTVGELRHESDWKTYQGFWLDASWAVHARLRIAVEVDHDSWSKTYNDVDAEVHATEGYWGGIRFGSAAPRRNRPFVQVLAGVDHAHGVLRSLDEYSSSGNVFAIQLGGGVSVPLRSRFSLRIAGDARVIQPWHAVFWHLPEWRARLGMAYRLRE